MNKVSEVMGWIMIICAGINFGAGVAVILNGEPISAKSLENTPEYKKAWRLIQAIDVAEAALMNLERGETS